MLLPAPGAARDAAGRVDAPGRLRSPRDVRTVFREGRRTHGAFVVVHVHVRADEGPARTAVAAGRRLGGAVVRNRAKRRLREALRDVAFARSVDALIVAKGGAAVAPWTELSQDVRTTVARAGAAAARG